MASRHMYCDPHCSSDVTMNIQLLQAQAVPMIINIESSLMPIDYPRFAIFGYESILEIYFETLEALSTWQLYVLFTRDCSSSSTLSRSRRFK